MGLRGLRARSTAAAPKSSDEVAIGPRLSRSILALSLPPSRGVNAAARSTRSSASETKRRRPCSTSATSVEERAGAKLHEVSSTLEGLLARIEDAPCATRPGAVRDPRSHHSRSAQGARRRWSRNHARHERPIRRDQQGIARRAEELTQTLSTVARDMNATLTSHFRNVADRWREVINSRSKSSRRCRT